MADTTTHDHHGVTLPDATIDAAPVRKVALIAAAAGGIGFVATGAINSGVVPSHSLRDWFTTYMIGVIFWSSLPFGALALMQIGYLTGASWGVIFRRCFQAYARTIPVWFVLGLPIVISVFVADGSQSPFWWSDSKWDGPIAEVAKVEHLRPEAVEENQHKIHDYLNPGFFAVRFFLYAAILFALAYFHLKWAQPAEATDDEAAKTKIYNLSGPGMLIWAGCMTFFATDWIMSVEPTWASSMFPVVFGMNQFITAFALSVLVIYTLSADKPEIMAIYKEKFRIDIGTLLYGFTMVWAYASFCQYMLIWAGNLPEEITYYLKRGNNGWQYLAYFLMAFHWLVPFVVFLFREVKTEPRRIKFMAGLLLFVCASDIIWWILPANPHPEGGWYVPMAYFAILMVGGVWGLAFAKELGKAPILPANKETEFLATWGHH